MDDELQNHLKWAISNEKNIAKMKHVFEKQKHVDSLFFDAHEDAFDKIDCMACANCCKTTGPMLLSADIARISKKLKLSESAFVETYLVRDNDGDFVFKSMPCPFLHEDNACGIYEYRPKACREFPHTNKSGQMNIFHLTRKNARICPAVSKILQTLMSNLT